jgi:C1A family cysteine protease
MKKNVLIFLITSLSLCLYAQGGVGHIAPLNPDFVSYSSSSDTASRGFMPSPLVYSFDSLPQMRSAIALPTVFDLRTTGLLTTPRAQGLVNTCWGFATMDAIQSVWARMGFATTDYSVENLVNCNGFLYTKGGKGGNASMAIAYLSRFGGPVYETSDPYVNSTAGTCKTVTKSDKPAIVSQALYLNKNINLIKQMVYQYGGVFTALSTLGLSKYYNATTHATYSQKNGGGSFDHAGTIVGWNDTLTVTIPGYASPSGKGAWIVKGTYGTSKFDNGYYYASYEDYFVGNYAAVYPLRKEKDLIDTIYYHDKLGQTTSWGNYVDSAYTLQKFTAPHKQVITSVGVYTSVAASMVDIEVYKQKTDTVNLSGLIASRKGLLCEYPGYNTFDIKAEVDSGDFYVKVRYHTPGYLFPIPIETAISNYSSPTILPTGSQWLKFSGSGVWMPVGAGSTYYNTFNLCLKVYAKNASNQPLFTTAKNKYCVNDTVVYKNSTYGTYDSYKWSFGEGATPLTATTSVNDSVKVVYSTSGAKKVTLTGITGSVQDSIVKGNAVNIVGGVPLYIATTATNDSILKNKTITLTALGADSYVWTNPTDINGTKGNNLSYAMGETGKLFKVTATLGQCTATDSVRITVYDNCASYDDIVNAKELTLDTKEGPFSNVCASWETNEPYAPAADSCTSQVGWCPGESNLHSTLWFKFTAPSTGAVKIVTTGFDDKIALYDAISTGTYSDIISGDASKYKLLAANDDSSATVSSATIKLAQGLTGGKTYWVQLDGSFGGVEGSAYITVSTASASAVNPTNADVNIIISNPTKDGLLTIRNAATVNQVAIYDLAGKLVKQSSYQDQSTISLNVSALAKGYYIVKLQTDSGTISNKILFE